MTARPTPDPPVPSRDALRAVRGAVTEILPHLPAHEVTAERTLADLGADSVDRVEILSLVADRLGHDGPLSALADLPDIGALVAHLTMAGRR